MRYDLKSFVELECDNVGIIANKTVAYLEKTIGFGERKVPWVFLNLKEVLSAIPDYITYFKKHKLLPRGCACTVLHKDLSLHIDALPVIAKMNFPILNTSSWSNRWYSCDMDLLASLPEKKDPLGLDNLDVSSIKNEELTLIAECANFNQPIILNSQQLHSVERTSDSIVPRVMMTFTFVNDPWELLK